MNNKIRGFTLIEIMVALFIFALMSVIAVTGMHRIFNARNAINQEMAKLSQVQTASVVLQRDFAQLIDRPIINTFGSQKKSFIGKPSQVTFTRDGYVNPFSIKKRSTLQRVSYDVSAGKLIRYTWPVLDQAPTTKRMARVLITGVSNIQFRYINNKGKTFPNWPVKKNKKSTSNNKQHKKPALPHGIEITLQLTNKGKMTLLIPIYASNLKQQHDEKSTTTTTPVA